MYRLLGLTFFVVSLAPLTAATDDSKAQSEAQIILTLPETSEPPDYAPERVTHLTIDGKNFTDPSYPTEQKVKVKFEGDKKTVKVVYDFWPNT